MKYTVLMALLGVTEAALDPYECVVQGSPPSPVEPCAERMSCLQRTVVDIRDSQLYQNSLNDDPTLAQGASSFYCIPEDWVKAALGMSDTWDETNDSKSLFEWLPPPTDDQMAARAEKAAGTGKAYVAGITCDMETGWCPYEDMQCVGRQIIQVDETSKQYQKMIRVDPTFAQGETSSWCVTDAIFEVGMQWNGKLNQAWGVEMKMWPIDEVMPVRADEQKPKKQRGTEPGGEWADNAGNSVKWDDGGITLGSEGNGKLIINGDEVRIKLSATTIATTALGAITVMSTLY